MSTATLYPTKRQIYPGVVASPDNTPGEKCPFEPYRLKDDVVIQTLTSIASLARMADYDSATLRAGAGLMMLIGSVNTRVEQGQAISRNQAMHLVGMDWKTIKRAVSQMNSLVTITENGQAFDYASGTSKATRYAVLAPEFGLTSNLPVNALMPNHPQWSSHQFGTFGWRLTLALASNFGQTLGEFTPAQVRLWTGWSFKKTERILGKLASSSGFITKAERGKYTFVPIALNNSPYVAAVRAEILNSEAAKAKIVNQREAQARTGSVPTTNPNPVKPIPDDKAERIEALRPALDHLAVSGHERWTRDLALPCRSGDGGS